VAGQIFTKLLSHPGFYSVVAEADGRIVASNVLDERSTIVAASGSMQLNNRVQLSSNTMTASLGMPRRSGDLSMR